MTANKLIEQLESLGILEEITGRKRGRIFSYTPFVAVFRDEPLEPKQARSRRPKPMSADAVVPRIDPYALFQFDRIQ